MHDLFLYAAILGGSLFLVQLVLSALGAGDADIDLGGGHHDASPTGHTSADTAFKLLSLQGLTAFFAMFGLTGLALDTQSGASPAVSIAGAVAAGAATTWIISRIFRSAAKLQSSGNLDMRNALGVQGTVYLGIAPNKPGKVTLTIQNRLVQADAISELETLATGSSVRVLRVLPEGTVVVGKV
jgi:membrane protein implicated in regulation of membrane protease activity